MELLLASSNQKKLAELETLLAQAGVQVLAPAAVGGLPDVIEDQDTFSGNARKKAQSAARVTGKWSLADDSGLCVDALNGAPGVQSARFAGEPCDDAANNALLLEKLEGVSPGGRSAHFICALALARPDGAIEAEFTGRADGRILERPRGSNDFGYDPLFLFTEEDFEATGKGFAELDPAQKSAVSHRGRALRALTKHLLTLLPH